MDYKEMIESSIKNMKTKLEENPDLLEWFKNYEPPSNTGYIFDSHENLKKIENLVSKDGHSGASFAIFLRNIKQELQKKL